MPKKPRDDINSPKIANYNLRRRKKKPLKKKCNNDSDSDSDSSSDYDPKDDKMEDMNPRELQRFIQKIFPSKAGKERMRQLDKIDELLNKKSKNKKKGKSNEEEDDEDDEDDDELGEDIILYDNYGFPEDENEMLDEAMKDMLNNNMKFNIVFTVNDKDVNEFDFTDYEEDEYDFEEDEEEDEDEEEEEDEEDDEEEYNNSKKSKNEKYKKYLDNLKKKPVDELTEDEWLELARDQEEEMRKNGTFYATKYNKNDNIMFKKKGWDTFKDGKIIKVNNHRIRRKVTYNIKLNKKFKGKSIYKNVLSNRLKLPCKKKDTLAELEELIKVNTGKGKKAMEKKFKELCEAKEKEDEKKRKQKEKKQKNKNFIKLRKLMRERNTSNDFKYFKEMDLDAQTKILLKLEDVNKFSKVEKPYRIALLESDIPVEFKADALKKINTLDYMDPGSGEYYKIKNWVDTFMRIPFGKHMNLPISINDGPEKCQEFMENAKKTLDEAVYGLEDAKMQILQMVGQWISNPNSLGTAIAVKGPPGTGKTTLIKEGVSKILNRPFAFLALGGATDSSYLEGHSYTYEGSIWGKIVDILLKCKCMNPVIYFDELDKISDTPKGEEIAGILTHLTDTTQNDKFHDKYFSNIDFNLSKAMFIFSYNDESKVNPILKDRMYRIKTDGYKTDQKCVIAENYLIPKIQSNINFEKGQIIIPEETKKYICDTLTDNEKGVRNLKRCLEIIYTKLNLYRLMKEGSNLFNKEEIIKVEFPFTVTKEIVDKLIKNTKENNTPFGMYL